MKRRPRRSIAAAFVALTVLAACVLVAAVAIQMLSGEPLWIRYHAVATDLHATRWHDPGPAIAGAVAAVLGLVLLLAGLLPGRLTILPLRAAETTGTGSRVDSGASRRSYRSTLRAAAATVDGVRTVRLKLRRRSVAAVIRTDRTNTTGLTDAVRAAIEHRIDMVDPATRPRIRIKVKAARSEQ